MQDRPGTVLTLQEGKNRPLRPILPQHLHHVAPPLLSQRRNPTLRHLHLLLGKLPRTYGLSLHSNHRKIRKETPILPFLVTNGVSSKPPHKSLDLRRSLDANSRGILLPAYLQRETVTPFFIIVMIIHLSMAFLNDAVWKISGQALKTIDLLSIRDELFTLTKVDLASLDP